MIADGMAFDTLFRRWDLDCIVVAANRLGAINHTLLTVRAARAAGLRVPAVVLNTVYPPEPTLAERTNLDTLRELIPDAKILPFPYNGGAHDLRDIC
jgi:dethiobiotin synthetase